MITERNGNGGAEVHQEVLDELRRRLILLDSREYQQSACYQMGNRILVDTIVWSVIAATIAGTTLFAWLR